MEYELHFKQYFEKVEQQPNYINTLQDELGIDPKTFENNPEWAASVSLGNVTYNGIMYKILRMVKNGDEITGAIVKPVNINGVTSPRGYIGSGSNKTRIPDGKIDTAEIFWPKNKLNSLLTQGMMGSNTAGGLPGGGF